MDQLSETYHASSPYAYVMNNPVNMFVFDPDGRLTQAQISYIWNNSGAGATYWGFNSDGSPVSIGHSDWNSSIHYAIASIYALDGGGGGGFSGFGMGNTGFAGFGTGMGSGYTSIRYWTGDATQTSYMMDGEMYGEGDVGEMHQIRIMDDDTVDNLNSFNDRIGDIASVLEKTRNQGGSIAFWTTSMRSRSFDGIRYSRFNFRYYRNNWGGNGYTGSTRSVAKYLGKGALAAQIMLGAIEVGNGVADDYNDYQTKGITYGKNTAVASAKVATGAAVGWAAGVGAGMAYGAVMGSAFPIVGTIIGAAVGAVAGYYASEYAGEIVKQAYE